MSRLLKSACLSLIVLSMLAPSASAATKVYDNDFRFTFSFTYEGNTCDIEDTFTVTMTFWGHSTYWDNGRLNIDFNSRTTTVDSAGNLVLTGHGSNPFVTGSGGLPMNFRYDDRGSCVGSGLTGSYTCNYHVDENGVLRVNEPPGC